MNQATNSTGVTGRACGKVILLGEHAVVYGVPALAVGIDRGASASAKLVSDSRSSFHVPAWGARVFEGDGATDLARAFTALLSAARTSTEGRERVPSGAAVSVEASTDLPPGGGLGCSAALGVAVARALIPTADALLASELAMAWERVFHGNPSGIDAAVAARGGSIVFEKNKRMDNVPLRAAFTVCIGSTGVSSSTKTMVDGLASLRLQKPDLVGKAFDGIAALVRNACLALEAGDLVGLGKLMDLNQMILSGLLLSTEEIERLCGTARAAGALGAKLTGAGGGGSVVALASDAVAAERILDAWQADGFRGFAASVQPRAEGRG